MRTLGQFGRAQRPTTLFNYFMRPAALFNYFTPLVALTAIVDVPFRFIFFSVAGEITQAIRSLMAGKIVNFDTRSRENVVKFVNQSFDKKQKIRQSATEKIAKFFRRLQRNTRKIRPSIA